MNVRMAIEMSTVRDMAVDFVTKLLCDPFLSVKEFWEINRRGAKPLNEVPLR